MKLNRIAATAAAAAITGTALTALPANASTPPVVVVTSPADSNPACVASQLRLTIGHERVNTGQVSYVLTAANRGAACTLGGFPRLSLLDGHRNPLPEVTAKSGKAHSVLVLGGLAAHLTLSFGSDGMTGERASYLKAGSDVAAFPGGPVLVSGGQVTVTSWTLPKRQ